VKISKLRLAGFTAFVAILCAPLTMPAGAQTFDTRGNGSLKGDYFVRQVVTTQLDPSTSAIGRAFSLTGVMTFDGKGNYTFAGQMVDTQAGSTATPYSTSGVYSAASNGLAQIQNPLDATDTEYGAIAGLGPLAIIASAKEGRYHDLFVAIAAGSPASNNTVNGSYQTGFIDFLQANASQVRDGHYTLTSTGNGALGSVTVSGAMANQGSNDVQQTFAGVTYSITAANGSGTIPFPTSATPLAALVSGPKTL
jgi:Flp pilus assembly pilin Flp